MTPALIIAGLLALCWGIAWACFLQFAPLGQWLAVRRTWVTVAVGVGVDLGILLLVLSPQAVGLALLVVGLSSIGLILRSFHNERKADAE